MKKKIDFKLTASLVGLFVGLIFTILGAKSKYFMLFGFLILGVSVIAFAFVQKGKVQKKINNLEQILYDEEIDDVEVHKEITKELKMLRKQKRSLSVTFNIFGGLLILLAFFVI
ncbi:MAG: hypothetical protein E7374_03805 [Clostridiales bacterium]|nr:hypothetical protein [Clostridiales bacterium]